MEATLQVVLCMLWGDMIMHEEGECISVSTCVCMYVFVWVRGYVCVYMCVHVCVTSHSGSIYIKELTVFWLP